MNRINKPSAFACLTIALSLALAGCGAAAPAVEPPLAGAPIGGEFTLTNSKGAPVRWGDFAGKYRIVYFGYTFCPDVCPTDMQRVAQGLKELKASDPDSAGKIVPIFITVDPQRDTPAVVGEFAAAFSPDMIGLTGTPAQIDAAAKAFKVYHAKGEARPGGGYLVDHTQVVYLFGPDGAPIATLPTDQGGDAVAAELARWVN
ncbi:SCO family protein [Porphyrobacter sp. AAP82]|uniref:SCO family protein n=1 Tax=Porphyrobacter sp. AAP82 TaxID=1248917 RepID=UPI000304CF19|nr:SCO family protein [Porphyrobacter sp. AAP82]